MMTKQLSFLATVVCLCVSSSALADTITDEKEYLNDSICCSVSSFEESDDPFSRDLSLSNEVIPWASIGALDIPPRTEPIFEVGDPYFDTGPLGEGFQIPTGAVWRPGLMAFGQLRSAIQTFGDGNGNQTSEWANRLDLFFNLRLTGTERIFASFRPLDQNGKFTGYTFTPDIRDEYEDASNFNLQTLFFEGDFDQLFPDWLNKTGKENNDYAFSVGRQPIFLQEGFLVNDVLDSIALADHNIHIPNVSNARSTLLFAWDNVNRDDNQESGGVRLYGVSGEADFHKHRVQADVIYSDANDAEGGDGIHTGITGFQRLEKFYTTLRMNNSWSLDNSGNEAVSTGTLFFGEISWEPTATNDIAYVNTFWGIDHFASAARDAAAAGPLGDTGILFAAKGLGAFAAPIANTADETYGAAMGYQKMINNYRTQLIGEIGVRVDNEPEYSHTIGVGAGIEQAVGKHTQVFVDSFLVKNSDIDNIATGLRAEISIKF